MPDPKPTVLLASSQRITGYYFRPEKGRVLLMKMNPAGKSYEKLVRELREMDVHGNGKQHDEIRADSIEAVHGEDETKDFVVGEFPDIESARQWLRAEQSDSFA